jgi:hypothetical protein
LLEADAAHSIAEQEFDRSFETREALEHAYLAAAQALDAEQHPRRAYAWLGLATVRRYQKGRRGDALAEHQNRGLVNDRGCLRPHGLRRLGLVGAGDCLLLYRRITSSGLEFRAFVPRRDPRVRLG